MGAPFWGDLTANSIGTDTVSGQSCWTCRCCRGGNPRCTGRTVFDFNDGTYWFKFSFCKEEGQGKGGLGPPQMSTRIDFETFLQTTQNWEESLARLNAFTTTPSLLSYPQVEDDQLPLGVTWSQCIFAYFLSSFFLSFLVLLSVYQKKQKLIPFPLFLFCLIFVSVFIHLFVLENSVTSYNNHIIDVKEGQCGHDEKYNGCSNLALNETKMLNNNSWKSQIKHELHVKITRHTMKATNLMRWMRKT